MKTQKSQLVIVFYPSAPEKRKEVVVASESIGVWHVVRRSVVSRAGDDHLRFEYRYHHTPLTAYNVYHKSGYVTYAYKTKAQALAAAEKAAAIFNGDVPVDQFGCPHILQAVDTPTGQKLIDAFRNVDGVMGV